MNTLSEIVQSASFGNLELLARLVVEGFITGLHKSPFHGFSVEFAEHRQYNSGESIKNIDWKLFGRTDKLFVKRFEEETNLRTRIVIDTSSSMNYPYKEKKLTKLHFSIYSAAALIHLLGKQRDASGLTFFSDSINFHSDTKMSSVHRRHLFNELENLLHGEARLQRKTQTAATLHHIADTIHKRSLVLVFTDLFSDDNPESLFSALQHFRYNKHEVVLFHVLDADHEETFSFQNRPYKFIDMETGEVLKLNPAQVKEIFGNAAKKFYDDIKMKCAQFGIDYVRADINGSFHDVLTSYLLKRKQLY